MKKAERNLLFESMLVVCMIIGGLLISSNTIYAASESGVDGEIKWEISGDTLTLSAVEGTEGKMSSYTYEDESPWQYATNRRDVKKIIIDSTVTELSAYAFNGEYDVDIMEIAGSVKVIPSLCMRNMDIEKLVLYEGVETIEQTAFFCRVRTVQIPKSVKNIDISSFGTVADGNTNYLQKVYGHAGSAAETYTNDYNAKVKATREADETKDYDSLDGFFGLDWDKDGCYDTEGVIEFMLLDNESTPDTEEPPAPETPSYELQINQNYTDSGLGNYNVGGNASDITYESDNEELKKVLAQFTVKYSAEKLIPLDITLSENGITISAKECTIKIPVPTAWNSHKESIKVLTVTDGQIEVVSSVIVIEDGTYFISFVPPHFSPYALYLDYNESENDTESNETPNTNNDGADAGSDDKELDDTPKTGVEFDPMVVTIICLVLVGVGLLILPRREF